jgi:hypothetical protein
MTLLDAPAAKPEKSRAVPFTISALVLVALVVLFFVFRYYPEKKAASNFFDALVAGDTNKAYALWKPSSSYQMKDFLADWGPQGYYGPIKSYKIDRAKSATGASGVAITVSVSPYSPLPEPGDAEKSRKTKTVSIWVEKSDKSFSFPP